MDNRETWLLNATSALRPLFSEQGYNIPEHVRVACGFPSKNALSPTRRRIGEAWSPACSADKAHEILISPTLSDRVDVVGVLIHELIHVAVGVQHGHKRPFIRAARALGLEGKPTATVLPVQTYLSRYASVISPLGSYPHGRLDARISVQKQPTRLLKAVRGDCGYTFRVTQKWVDVGLPTCCCGGDFEIA